MLKIKAAFLSATLVISSQAFAASEEAQNSQLSQLFGVEGNNALQVATLSDQEAQETQGAFGPVGATVGGVLGAGGYLIDNAFSSEPFSWTKLAITTGTAAAVGAMPLTAPGIIWAGNFTVAGRTAYGVANATHAP